jgi:hypothetical protein
VLFNNTVNCWDYNRYRRKHEDAALVLWDWQRKTGVFGEENLFQAHFVHQESHMNWPGTEPVLRGDRLATNRLRHGMAPYIMTEVLCMSTKVYWPHITYLMYASESYCNKVEKYKRRLFRASKTSFCSSYGKMLSLCSEPIWTAQHVSSEKTHSMTIACTQKAVNLNKLLNTEAVFQSSQHVLFETFFASINTYRTTFARYTSTNTYRFPRKMSVVFVRLQPQLE